MLRCLEQILTLKSFTKLVISVSACSLVRLIMSWNGHAKIITFVSARDSPLLSVIPVPQSLLKLCVTFISVQFYCLPSKERKLNQNICSEYGSDYKAWYSFPFKQEMHATCWYLALCILFSGVGHTLQFTIQHSVTVVSLVVRLHFSGRSWTRLSIVHHVISRLVSHRRGSKRRCVLQDFY